MKKDYYLFKLYKRHEIEYKNQKDSRKDIRLPDFCPKMAEFTGALSGDGHLTASKGVYRVGFALNGTEDIYYIYFLADLFRELFHVEPRIYFRDCSNRADIEVNCKKIHGFIEKFFPKGKKNSLDVPDWVKGKEMISAYLRGLIDTNGSLFFAKRGIYEKNCYPVIELKMEDEKFLDQVELLLQELDIGYYRSADNKIQLNGKSKLENWILKVGFSNPNRSSRYYVWKVQKYCPSSTSLGDRLEMLGIKPG